MLAGNGGRDVRAAASSLRITSNSNHEVATGVPRADARWSDNPQKTWMSLAVGTPVLRWAIWIAVAAEPSAEYQRFCVPVS